MADYNRLLSQPETRLSQTSLVGQTGSVSSPKPRAIHLNPNFFSRDVVRFHQQHAFRNQNHVNIHARHNHNNPYPRFNTFPRPPRHHNHNQRYQSTYERFHYNRFQPNQGQGQGLHSTPHLGPTPYFHFQDPVPRFNPPFSQNLNQGPPPNFQFGNNSSHCSSNPEFFNPGTSPAFTVTHSQPQTTTERLPEPEQYVGPSYYEAYNDNDITLPSEYNPVSSARNFDDYRQKYKRRSASTFSYSSGSSYSRGMGDRSTRSRSNSSSVSSRRDSISNSSSWNSDSDRNSDSDFDLSKPLEPLTEIASNPKSLLKDVFKCLGNSKLKSMIPLELEGIGKKKLRSLCKQLLDEMDTEHVIQIMKGTSNSIEHETENESMSATTETTESDTNTSQASETSEKIKKEKKKRRRKKKNLGFAYEDKVLDSDESSRSSIPVVSTTTNLPPSTINQSLLELIQIEYKAKAINVMLTNLGVASDITSMISNALSPILGHQSKSSQPQDETTDLVDGKQYNASNLKVNPTSANLGSSSMEEFPSNDLQTKMNISPIQSPCNASTNVKTHDNVELKTVECRDLKNSSSTVHPDFLNIVDSDVLDLDISSHEKIKLPDDI